MRKTAFALVSETVTAPLAYWKGLRFYRARQWELAAINFERAIIDNPKHAPSHFKLGMCHYRQQTWHRAADCIATAIKLSPSRADWKEQKTKAEKERRKIDPAHSTLPAAKQQKLIKKLIVKDPRNAELHGWLAQSLRQQANWWQEIDALKTALDLTNGRADWFFKLGEAHEVMCHYEEAADAYAKAIELDPLDCPAQWHYRYGYALERAHRDSNVTIQTAKNAFHLAIDKDKTLSAKRFGIGVFHQARGHWKQAAAEYQRTLAQQPFDAELHYRVGLAHDRNFEWEKAIEHYENAIAIDTKQPVWHHRLGYSLEQVNRLGDSAQAYGNASTGESSVTAISMFRKAIVLHVAGSTKHAVLTHNARSKVSVNENADGPDLQQDGSYLVRGARRVIENLKVMLRNDATNSDSWRLLGSTLRKVGEHGAALDAYMKALERSQEHPAEIFDEIGQIFTLMGNQKEAARYFEQSVLFKQTHSHSVDPQKMPHPARLTAIYQELCACLPICQRTIMYESFHGKSLGCNPYAIFEQVMGDPTFHDYKHVWVAEDKSIVPQKWLRHENVIFVKPATYAYVRWLATAEFLINNGTFPALFMRRGDQRYLNTWHGTPWKTLGTDMKDRFLEHRNFTRNLLHATHVLSPNAFTTEILVKRHGVESINSFKLIEMSYPRVQKSGRDQRLTAHEIRLRVGAMPEDKLVLYAPTYRGSHKDLSLETEATTSVINTLSRPGYRVIVRLHTLVESSMKGELNTNQIAPRDIDTNELLAAVDLLVTDYSSIAFDAIEIGKPTILHIHDVDDYQKSRGLYFSAEVFPTLISRTSVELMAFMSMQWNDLMLEYKSTTNRRRAFEKLLRMPSEMTSVQDLLSSFLTAPLSKPTTASHKKSILIAPGTENGCAQLIRLLEILEKVPPLERPVITLLFASETVTNFAIFREFLEKIPSWVNMVGVVGAPALTLEESWIYNQNLKVKNHISNGMKPAIISFYRREFIRNLGHSRFDQIINLVPEDKLLTELLAYGPQQGEKFVFVSANIERIRLLKKPDIARSFEALNDYDCISVSDTVPDYLTEKIHTLAPGKTNDIQLESLILPKTEHRGQCVKALSSSRMSVIVPIYNVAEYLPQCVKSLELQSSREFEVIFVNDCSPDNSIDILQTELQNVSFPWKLVNLPVNGGLGNARNVGLEQAQGEYILFLDSDDWLTPDAIEILAKKARSSQADVIFFDFFRTYPNGISRQPGFRKPYAYDFRKTFALTENPAVLNIINLAQIKAYRRAFLSENGFQFRVGVIYEDVDWTFKTVTTAKSLSILNEPVYHYRQGRAGSILGTKSKKHFDVLSQYDVVFKYIKETNKLEFFPYIYDYFIGALIAVALKNERIPPKLVPQFIQGAAKLASFARSLGSYEIKDPERIEFDRFLSKQHTH